MKYNIDALIVVEGKADVSYLSSFINAHYFTTNGLDINKEKLNFLLEASKVRKIIVLTDDDDAGRTIRKTILEAIPTANSEVIPANSRGKYKKSGIAESTKEEVIKALEKNFVNYEICKINYNLNGLISLSKNPSAKKEEIIKKYRLIIGNNKSIENQLNILKITKEELWK